MDNHNKIIFADLIHGVSWLDVESSFLLISPEEREERLINQEEVIRKLRKKYNME